MKRAVSISLGSPSRDKTVELTLLGEQVRPERTGTNGDEQRSGRFTAGADLLLFGLPLVFRRQLLDATGEKKYFGSAEKAYEMIFHTC